MGLSYIQDWCDPRCSTENSESLSGRGYTSPLPAPSPLTETNLEVHVVCAQRDKGLKLELRRPVIPLWKGLARGVKHTTSSSVQKANFAPQHFHQVALPTSTHLHLPQVIGVSCSVLWGDQMCFKIADIKITRQPIVMITAKGPLTVP